jgi:hypothetical protein
MKLAIVLLVALWSLEGCTVLGYLGGAAIDRGLPDFDTLKTCSSIECGDDLRIVTADGTVFDGTLAEPVVPSMHSAYANAGPVMVTGDTASASCNGVAPGTSIALNTRELGHVRVPADSIARVMVPHTKSMAIVGLVMGATVDTLFVVSAIDMFSSIFRVIFTGRAE